jgi:TatD DNase family protein
VSTVFFDSHAHLDGFGADLEEVLSRARAAGVSHIVAVGASDKMKPNYTTVEIAEKHERIFAAVAVHPHDASIVDRACVDEIERIASHPKVVAIGETGLDYHYDHSPRKQQEEAFIAFIDLARRMKKPLVIHTREADQETVDILKRERAEEIGGIIHCFTGTELLAKGAIEIGFYISFSGVLTFRNADLLRAIAKDLPRDRVLVETDCPYLTPVPLRGKKNEPAFVVHTAEKLAEIWSLSFSEVKRITGENAARAFRIPIT